MFMRVLRQSVVATLFLIPASSLAMSQKVALVAVGDVCLARGVQSNMVKFGADYPFRRLKPILSKFDIAFGNLECCLAVGGTRVQKQYNFRGDPRNAAALKQAGFNVVSLANNHAIDYGAEGLKETLQCLKDQGILAVGAGETLSEAHSPRIVTMNGLRIGFLAYLGLFPSFIPLHGNQPGLAMAYLDAIRRDVGKAKKNVDFLIVSMHAGVEYAPVHYSRQSEIAHAAIDAGADMVVGAHPHIVQDIEIYKHKPIYFSLGNCIFDPSPQFLRGKGRNWSGMVAAVLEKGKPLTSKFFPLQIVDRQPRMANSAYVARLDRFLAQRR